MHEVYVAYQSYTYLIFSGFALMVCFGSSFDDSFWDNFVDICSLDTSLASKAASLWFPDAIACSNLVIMSLTPFVVELGSGFKLSSKNTFQFLENTFPLNENKMYKIMSLNENHPSHLWIDPVCASAAQHAQRPAETQYPRLSVFSERASQNLGACANGRPVWNLPTRVKKICSTWKKLLNMYKLNIK